MFDNHATNGGGGAIAFIGSSGAELHINAGTEISRRSTADGGGIYIGGAAHLFMIQNNSIVYFDGAGGGGGISVNGPASADIASSGKYNLAAAVYENTAVNGGGIAVVANQNGGSLLDATLRLFSIDATHPVRISNNSATSKGGGLLSVMPYLSATIDNDISFAVMCGNNFRIDDSGCETERISNEENRVAF